MSRDLRRMYAELGDIDPVTLPAPDVLRGRADRRARSLVVAGSLAIALLAGGTAVAVNAAFVRTEAPPLPGTSVSVTPTRPTTSSSAVASPTALPPPTGPIPDSAFFIQPKERQNNHPPDPLYAVTELDLPSLCGTTFPATVSRGRARHLYYYALGAAPNEIPLGTVDQSILVLGEGGAAATMQRLRTAVAACPRETRDGGTVAYTTPATTGFGDEYVLLRVRWSGVSQPYGEQLSLFSYYSVVRIGEVITVLTVVGWENIDADRGVTDEDTRLAVTALRGWLG